MSDAQAQAALRQLIEQRKERATFGWKVAINAQGAQRRLGLSHALAAPLDDSRVALHDGTCSLASASQLHLEAELGLVLAVDVTVALGLSELRAAIASYVPCLELVDYALPKRDWAAMFAHSFFHAGVVLGTPVAASDFVELPPPFPQVLSSAGVVRSRAEGAVPDDVVLALQALSERVLEAGGTLRQGQIVLCGSYVDPVPFPSGAALRVDFGPHCAPISLTRS